MVFVVCPSPRKCRCPNGLCDVWPDLVLVASSSSSVMMLPMGLLMSLRKSPNPASFCVLISVVSLPSDRSILQRSRSNCRLQRSAFLVSLLLDWVTSSSLAFAIRSRAVKLLSPPPKFFVARIRAIAESEGASPKCGLFLLMSWMSNEFVSPDVRFAVSGE